MKRRVVKDPYQTLINHFNRQGVAYVVVEMAGINYYAKNASEMFSTLDYDVFLQPTLHNVEKAVQCLEALGVTLSSRMGIFKGTDLKQVVRQRMTLVATTEEGIMIELLLKISGYPFSELAKDAATFTVQGIPVHVGRLSKLLRSKRLANRPKDRQFLQRYRFLLEEK